MIEPLVVSASVVGIAELGDRTQLLSLVLACRYRRPVKIICGIFGATLVNNIIAGFAGHWVGDVFASPALKWIIGFSFLGMAVWVLLPEKSDAENTIALKGRNALITAFVSFLIAEMGDKTQIATAALAAHYHQLLPIIIGSTFGIMAVNVPIVLLGHGTGNNTKIFRVAHYIAAVIFLIEAILTFSGYKLF